MQDYIVLLVRFVPKAGLYEEFRGHLYALSNAMKNEQNFVNTIIHESVARPGEMVLYEIWRGTKDSFMAEEAVREYRRPYRKYRDEMLAEFSAEFFTPIAEWGSSLTSN